MDIDGCHVWDLIVPLLVTILQWWLRSSLLLTIILFKRQVSGMVIPTVVKLSLFFYETLHSWHLLYYWPMYPTGTGYRKWVSDWESYDYGCGFKHKDFLVSYLSHQILNWWFIWWTVWVLSTSLDLYITHERWGSSSNPLLIFNYRLH